MNVAFCDVSARNRPYAAELLAAYLRAQERGLYILGPEVEAFEHQWAKYCGFRHSVGVGNGTEAIALLLEAHGIGPGDEVIVPAHTCIATWIGVSKRGAIPVPVDVDIHSYNMDPRQALQRVGQRTAAILGVHLYGRPANIPALRVVAKAAGVPLLVDAAQAHGITGAMLGDGAAFSFYPTKNLGALGDAGAVVTNDAQIDAKVRCLRHLGSLSKDRHAFVAGNSRMDELQAAFLSAKLPRLNDDNEKRRRNAVIYRQRGSVFHQCVTLVEDRKRFRADLLERGVETMVHYPTPPHLQPAYASLGYGKGAFPVAERIADCVVSLPVGPEIDNEQAEYVADAIAECV